MEFGASVVMHFFKKATKNKQKNQTYPQGSAHLKIHTEVPVWETFSNLSACLARRTQVWVTLFPSQDGVINWLVSHIVRHRSAGSGEAGATAAHIPGPELHQQVHTFSRGQYCSTSESLHARSCDFAERISNDWCLLMGKAHKTTQDNLSWLAVLPKSAFQVYDTCVWWTNAPHLP